MDVPMPNCMLPVAPWPERRAWSGVHRRCGRVNLNTRASLWIELGPSIQAHAGARLLISIAIAW